MRKISIFLAGLLLISCESGESSFLDLMPEIRDLETGAVLPIRKAKKSPGIYGQWQTQLFDSEQSISFIRISPSVYHLDILCGEGASADSTSALCLRNNAVAGMNGSYFNMQELTHVTYLKDDGVEAGANASDEKWRTNGTLFLGPDKLDISATDTTDVIPEAERWWEALTGGPILIDDGQTVTYQEGIRYWKGFYNKRHPRSLVGTDPQGYIWLVVVDGRNKDDGAEGMTIAELTALAQMIGLTDALNLDGGGSSTLWSRAGGVLSYPSDNERFDHEGQRVVPNVLAVKR